jgi:SAM-dependent methyltransferase
MLNVKQHLRRLKNSNTKALIGIKLRQLKSKQTSSKKIKQIHNDLVFNNHEELQKKIDALDYPPTHQYRLEPLKPDGFLRNRYEIMKLVSPDFFTGENFLDVGCNKGFFSLLASQNCNSVTSIDFDKRFTDLCIDLAQKNMTIQQKSFREFIPRKTYDRILLGNVHHYIYKETGNWDWIKKLAVISTDKVMVEGAVSMKCNDMKIAIPKSLQSGFNDFLVEMTEYFDIIMTAQSMSPDRSVILFQRKKDKFGNSYQLNDLKIDKVIKDDPNSMVLKIKENKIAKINKLKPDDIFPISKINTNIARLSPISNNAVGSVYDGDKFVGWLEDEEPDVKYKYKENQKEMFQLHCTHMQYLARLNYFDGDCSMINVFKVTNKLFDKGMVIPIPDMTNQMIDYYFKYMDDSYDLSFDTKTKLFIQGTEKDIQHNVYNINYDYYHE